MSDNDMSAQYCGCDPGANWKCKIHSHIANDPNIVIHTQETSRPTNPKQPEAREPILPSKPGEDHMAEANGLVNGDRQAAYGSPRPAYVAMAQVWSGLIAHKLKEPLTAEDVVILLAGMKLRREALKHKRDNIVDTHGYLLVLAHTREDGGN